MQSKESHELANGTSEEEELKEKMKSQKADRKRKKLKEKLLKETSKVDNRGVCYLSRIPPHMDHVRLRQILSQFGEIGRIYLAPENPEAQMNPSGRVDFEAKCFLRGGWSLLRKL